MMPPSSSISVKMGWIPLPKSMRTPCWEPVVKPLNKTLFSNEHWSFKQDLAPAWKAKSTKVWLRGIFQTSLLWVFPGNWPFSSSDLNPMASKNGQCLKAWSVRRGTLISKAWCYLVKAVMDFPLRNSIDGWSQRLSGCVKARGGHFEKKSGALCSLHL